MLDADSFFVQAMKCLNGFRLHTFFSKRKSIDEKLNGLTGGFVIVPATLQLSKHI